MTKKRTAVPSADQHGKPVNYRGYTPHGATQQSVEIWTGNKMNWNQLAENYPFALISPRGISLVMAQKLGSPI